MKLGIFPTRPNSPSSILSVSDGEEGRDEGPMDVDDIPDEETVSSDEVVEIEDNDEDLMDITDSALESTCSFLYTKL